MSEDDYDSKHDISVEELDIYESIDGNEPTLKKEDLYDAAMENTDDERPSKRGNHSPILFETSVETEISTRNYCCYVGNMTWWTTDAELEEAMFGCGLDNLVDTKFYDHRMNGKSRGIAVAIFSNESSMKDCQLKLPKKSIHGRQLVVLPYTKAALAQLQGGSLLPNDKRAQAASALSNSPGLLNIGTIRLAAWNTVQRSTAQYNSWGLSLNELRSWSSQQIPPPQPQLLPALCPPHPPLPPPLTQQTPSLMYPQIPPPPQAYLQMAPPTQPPIYYSAPPPVQINPLPNDGSRTTNEAECEEIVNRNRVVSSSAISRAVADAASGDISSAIETLVTAIGLIRASQVYADPRTKILVSSLEDTLHGIESRSLLKRQKHRTRSPSRSSGRKHRRHEESPEYSSHRHSSSSTRNHH